MAIDNVTFLNSVAKEMTAEYNDRIPTATQENLSEISETISQYPTLKNDFIKQLTNLVAKTVVISRQYSHKYKFLHKGSLPYGTTIEMIIADVVKGKTFTENFGTANTDIGSLLSKEENQVKVEYIQRNVQLKYKNTISTLQLMGAFRSENGLSELVNALATRIVNSMELDEELLIQKAINSVEGGAKAVITGYVSMTENEKAKALTKSIMVNTAKMEFLTNKYNKSGVHTFSKPNELVIFATPETQAMIDVELLASTYHMDKAEVSQRIVLVPEFMKVTGDDEVVDSETLAIIMDVNAIQLYDNLNTSGTFENPDGLYTNIFYHSWKTVGVCNHFNSMRIKTA